MQRGGGHLDCRVRHDSAGHNHGAGIGSQRVQRGRRDLDGDGRPSRNRAAHSEAARAAAIGRRVHHALPGIRGDERRGLVPRDQRCRALTQPADADELLTHALAELDRTAEAFEQARTHLHLGENLRLTRRRRQSRVHLTEAEEAFTLIGATPWAARAQGELLASGERLGTRMHPQQTSDQALTPQELRVALEVARGESNSQVAARLFLSAKTVEFHLGKTYRKLGVRSRGGLAQALSERGLLDMGR